ncbi:MAG TPA: FtsX-like permease family protein [Polyangiaceae bacterium]|jgi:ABC-type lipoprotein release transport system permease subunit|nr:FtsX-like permease family protein [Polyangiaceae bacterium]
MFAFLVDARIALLNLVEHRRRTLFLGSAVAVVTMLLVLLTALSTGVRQTLIHSATTLSTGHLNIGGFYKVTAGQAGPVVTEYAKVLDLAKKTLPEMDFAVERGRGWAKVVADRGSFQAAINGIDIDTEPEFKKALELESGNLDDLSKPNTMLVFAAQAKKLELKVGDAVTISSQTTRGVANTIDCRVVAIARDIGLLSQWNTFISNESLRTLYQLRPDVTGAIQIMVKPAYVEHLAPLAGRLRAALEQAGYRVMEPDARPFWMKFQSVSREDWTGQKYDVTTWEDELQFLMWTLTALNGISVVLVVILIAIMVTGIMNTLWIAIRERTREIGALRAIGMQRAAVARLFLMEASALGLIGGCVGVVLGAGVAALVNAAKVPVPKAAQLFLMADTVRLAVEPGAVTFAIVLITLVSGAAALYPSLRAARLRPVDAMSHFG